ncbi:hypothetical protein [Actinoplanes aureus]|uniref:Integral membrane protein n=1 Tax=Actinoplanes aureus TaxID=2792083 RepID=A0A931G581_9ACTN|nr:hypothetical protein [Actinoplanes aureus]MBG0568636.1 hypothetical protein [Actinoplanes aureus]
MSYFALLLAGLAAAATSHCDDAEHHAACAQDGFWWATTGLLYLTIGGLAVAVIGAWIWPRRARWAWIGAGYVVVFVGFVNSRTLLGGTP